MQSNKEIKMEKRFNDPEFLRDQRKKTIKELATLKQMAYNWKNRYVKDIIDYKGDNLGNAESWEFLCKEFMAEIEDHMYPYVQRFKDLEFITKEETQEFMSELYEIIDELRKEIPKIVAQKERERLIKEETQKDTAKELEKLEGKYTTLLARLEALEGK